MVGDPYEAQDDPACYPGTTVLRNIPDIRDADALEAFELEAFTRRSLEPLPEGDFDVAHYRALHRHLFQDVYEWAGRDRTIRISKGGNVFCYPEYIDAQLQTVFASLDQPALLPGASTEAFIPAVADFLAELNAVHPFREGNGRTQLVFLNMLGLGAGLSFRLESIEPEEFLRAMIDSFDGKLDALIDELERMLA